MVAAATVPGILQTGIHSARPAASAVGGGSLYSCTTHDLVYQSDGVSTWTTWATLGGVGGTTITTKDEGATLSATVTTLDFVGAGVVASGSGATTTVTISGAAVADILDLPTAETDGTLVLAPDGAGGVEFRTEAGGPGGGGVGDKLYLAANFR